MVAGLFLMSLVDLIGFALLVPLLILGTDVSGAHTGQIGALLSDLFGRANLHYSFESVLILFVFLVLGKSLISVGLMHFSANTVMGVTESVRLRLAQNILQVRWPWLLHQPTGRLSNIVSHEAAALGEMFHNMANLLAMTLQVIAYGVLALLISWPVAVCALILGSIMFSWFGAVVRIKDRSARAQAEAANHLAAGFSDIIAGIRPMRAMGRVNRLLDVFGAQAQALRSPLRAKLVGADLSSELLEPISAITIAVWFYLAVTVWHLQIHSLVVVGLLLVRITNSLFLVYRLLFRVIDGRAQYQAILSVLEETETQREVSQGTDTPHLGQSIAVEGLGFSYGDKPVLRNLSLDIETGSVTALTGLSGAGKSTLIDLLLGFQRPSEGRILIDGVSLFDRISLQSWRSMIGYVPQEQFLFNDTIMKNVTLGEPSISEAQVVEALKLAQAWSFVEALPDQIHARAGERGSALSGGQRQRITIARALVHSPRLLILDEATTALDPATEDKVCSAICDYAHRNGVTVLVISHQRAWLDVADVTYRMFPIADGETETRLEKSKTAAAPRRDHAGMRPHRKVPAAAT
jgi:ATP-binding cassette subfamily C protein